MSLGEYYYQCGQLDSAKIYLEQCLEKASPNTMNVVDAHIIDLKEVKYTFKPLLQS